MSFMQPQVVFGDWFEVETTNGTEYVPAELIGDLGIEQGSTLCEGDSGWDAAAKALRDYCEGDPQEVKLISGYGARLSAPGYLDCTEWCVFETETEAHEYLREVYGKDDEPTEPEEGDYTTEDHINWYQYGKLVLTTPDPTNWQTSLKAHMEAERFWPNVWFISDHGNAHLIELENEHD